MQVSTFHNSIQNHLSCSADSGHAREELIAAGMVIVKRLCRSFQRRLPAGIESDDLTSAGVEGLLKAIDSHDPALGRFEDYATIRIRGAIQDELRKFDCMTRYGRKRCSDFSKTIQQLENQLGRTANEAEIANELGVDIDSYYAMLQQFSQTRRFMWSGGKDPDQLDSGLDDPHTKVSTDELMDQVAQAAEKLSKRSQTVLKLYYQDGCTQAEIGKMLGVSESRICQILSDSFSRLRTKLENHQLNAA
ncbi:MAG: sigma-70 family RNA polymerase sigma factor [Myxococcales bacterium]|nr:MAG: sigma-70 family RNA polymerase sigma factor [Myxococcales bacterium]